MSNLDKVGNSTKIKQLTTAGSKTEVASPALKIDWEQLHSISGHSPEFEQELLQTFLQDAVRRLGDIEAAIAAQDFDQLYQAAHHIKGSTANLGLTSLYGIATVLEQEAQLRSLQSAPTHLKHLQALLEQMRELVVHA